MWIYLVIPILLIVYFELLGQVILNKLNYPIFRYNSPIGFIVFSAFIYIVMMGFLFFHAPTTTLFIICSLTLIVSAFLIIMNFRTLKINVDYTLFIVGIFMLMAVYKFYNTGIGNRAFDSSYYLTWISSIIEYPNLNEFSIKYGPTYKVQAVGVGDMFLTYYQLAAYFVWAGKQLFENILNYDYGYMPAFMWTMAILYFNFFISTICNLIEKLKIKNKFVIILTYIFIAFYIGNLYWHNSYAFYGNTYRFFIVAYVVYFLFEIINKHKDSNFILLLLASLALGSTGTSSTFFMVLIGYAYLFTNYDNDENIIRNTSVLLFVPFGFLVFISDNAQLRPATILTITLMVIAIIFNDRIYKLFKQFNLFKILMILLPLILIIISQYIFGFSENLDKFFNHISGVGDMTWEFFKYRHWQHYIVNTFVYIIFVNYAFRHRKEPFAKFLLIILLTFLNPLNSALIAYRVETYLRSFDILLNPFTYIVFINALYETLAKNKYLQKTVFIILTLAFSIVGYSYFSTYYNPVFEPTDDFNHIYKIDKSELETIEYINGIIESNDLQDVKIITHIEYFRAFQPLSSNIYTRYYKYYGDGSDEELFEIFYPLRDYSERKDDNLYDYENAYELLIENRYDFVICDKQYDLYNVEKGWYYPRYQILDYHADPVFENDKYMVFWTYLDK